MTMTVNIDEEDFLELLMNQLKGWTTDETALELFKEMKKEGQLSSSVYKEAIKSLDHKLGKVKFHD